MYDDDYSVKGRLKWKYKKYKAKLKKKIKAIPSTLASDIVGAVKETRKLPSKVLKQLKKVRVRSPSDVAFSMPDFIFGYPSDIRRISRTKKRKKK